MIRDMIPDFKTVDITFMAMTIADFMHYEVFHTFTIKLFMPKQEHWNFIGTGTPKFHQADLPKKEKKSTIKLTCFENNFDPTPFVKGSTTILDGSK